MHPSQQAECTGGYRPPQFDIKFLMMSTAALAVWLTLWSATSVGSKVVLAAIMLTFLFGCDRSRRSVAWVTPALFLPYCWLLWDWNRNVWHEERGEWLSRLWQLPGVLLDVGMHSMFAPWFSVLTVVGTIAVFFTFVMLGRISRPLSVVASVLALLFSILNSLICLALVS